MTNEIRDKAENRLRAWKRNKKWLANEAGLAQSTVTNMLQHDGSSSSNSWDKVLKVLDYKLTVVDDG